jgi:hypothetical protein
MEPENDPQLSKLLREWKVPDAPPSLDRRVLGQRQSWWSFLLTGTIRIPVPVAIAILAAILALTVSLAGRRPAPPVTTISLKDFQPVENPNVQIIRMSYEAR